MNEMGVTNDCRRKILYRQPPARARARGTLYQFCLRRIDLAGSLIKDDGKIIHREISRDKYHESLIIMDPVRWKNSISVHSLTIFRAIETCGLWMR